MAGSRDQWALPYMVEWFVHDWSLNQAARADLGNYWAARPFDTRKQAEEFFERVKSDYGAQKVGVAIQERGTYKDGAGLDREAWFYCKIEIGRMLPKDWFGAFRDFKELKSGFGPAHVEHQVADKPICYTPVGDHPQRMKTDRPAADA